MVRKWQLITVVNLKYTILTDNICNNALDMTNRQLIVEDNWPEGTYCQWLISAQNDDDYVTIEFQNINVRKNITFHLIVEMFINQIFLRLRDG